jgi:hypothetical protein
MMTDSAAARQVATKACYQALVKLETRAGIAEAAEKLRTEPGSYSYVYDVAERYGDKHRELLEEETTFHQETITRKFRKLYFSVPDAKLRKQLIAKSREEGDLALRYWQQELSDAAQARETARKAHDLVGALAGLLVGFFYGWRTEQVAVRDRAAEIADAERNLKEAEQLWDEVRNEPQMFSQLEAQTGEPDDGIRR